MPGASTTARLAALRTANARPALRRLQAAWGGSFAGESIATVAFAVIAYRSAGASGIAALVGLQMLPAAVLAPLVTAGGWRLERERLVLAVDAVRTLLAAAAAALAQAGAPREALFALAAALTAGTAISNPPRRALLPLLVGEPSELTAASVATSVVQAAAQTAGPVLAGVLFTVTDAGVVLAVAACWLAAATVAEARLPSTAEMAVRPRRAERAWRSLSRGFRAVRSDQDLRLVGALFAAKNVARGALNVLIVLVPVELLSLGSAGVGWLTAVAGTGGVLGGIAAAVLVGRRRLVPPMATGLALWGLPLLALALLPHLAVAVAALLALGVGNTVTDVAGYTLIGRSARDDVLASVYAAHEAVRAVAITGGSAVTAAVAELWGARPALGVAGAGLVLSALAGQLLRGQERVPEPKPEQLALVRANPLFGWLPPVALARLAGRLVPVELAAGATLLRQGDEGDRAYLVAAGELVAETDGREIGRLAPGAVVGEIALLRNAPRMATVRALTACRLFAIDREEFVAAATGNDAARDESERLVEGRLAEASQPAVG